VVQQLLAATDASPSTLAAATNAALRAHYPDIARLLLAAGAEPGGGALHTAAQTGPAGIVPHLIALGADVDERIDGLTPIESWYAGERAYNDAPVLQALLDAGADGCALLAKLPPHSDGRRALLRARPGCVQ
jgi:ankyrin repeat protein